MSKPKGYLTRATKAKEKLIVQMYTDKYTTTEIANSLVMGRETISKVLESYGIPRRGVKKNIDSQEAIRLYLTGMSLKNVGEKLGVSQTAITNILGDNNIKLRSPNTHVRKYFFNESYFENIDTEAKAYFLGLLYADGNVTKEGSKLQLRLQEEDRYIIERFRQELGNCAPSYFIKKTKPNRKNQYGFSAHSKKLCSDLIKLGCLPNKSLILKFPTEEQVPKHLLHHFIRGYFDGDGHIGIYQYKHHKPSKHFSITGTKACLGKLQQVFIENCNVSKTKISTNSHHKSEFTGSLSYSGNIQIDRIATYLYKDGTIFLIRKKEKFERSIPDRVTDFIPFCTICGEKTEAKGLCRKHYKKEYRKQKKLIDGSS